MRPAQKYCLLLVLSILLGSAASHAQVSSDGPPPTTLSQPDLSQSDEQAGPPQAAAKVSEQDSPAAIRQANDAVDVQATPPPPTWLAPQIERPTAPDVFLLPDATGKLRKVLGFRYEDFLKAWKADDQEIVTVPPRFQLDAWSITGEVNRTHAQLSIEFEVSIQASGWVDIPLQLPELIVQQIQINDQAEGECVTFDQQRHGYVLWLSGEAGDRRKVALQGLAKLQSNGSSGIEFHLPRASTSQFSVVVPKDFSRIEASPELSVETIPREDGRSEVRLLGQSNPLRLSWTVGKQDKNEASPVEVEETTKIQLDRRIATYHTTLRVNNFDRPLQQIRVRLPRRAKIRRGEPLGDYEIQEVEPTENESQRQEILIRRSEPSRQAWTLNLVAERTIESFANSAECRLEGFEVLGAFQQSGSITLEVDDQLQAYFDVYDEIEQVPVDTSRLISSGRSVLGQFRYARFPWQLVVFTSPRQRRVSVRPTYQLSLDSDQARLGAEFDYQLTGAKVFRLRVNLQGWKLTDVPVASSGTIDLNGVVETHRGWLVLPLIDPSTTKLTLKLNLQKDIQLGDNTFFLPEALDSSVVDGELLVRAAEPLRLTPNLDEMTGLSLLNSANVDATEGAAESTGTSADQIRLRTFLPQPKFTANLAQRKLQIAAALTTQVGLDQSTTRVQQQIGYQVKYKAVSQLALRLPEQLWSNDTLKLTLNGEQLPLGLSADLNKDPKLATGTEGRASAEDNLDSRQVVVSLPRPMQGEIPLRIAYEIPTPTLAEDELTPILLPLASPVNQVTGHDARVQSIQPVSIAVNQRSGADAWTVNTREMLAENSNRTLELRAGEQLSYLSLYAQLDAVEESQLATLERAWIQSWIAINQRQERAVFRFRTPHAKVFVQLPPSLADAEIELLLDGKPWSYELLADNRLAVSLSANGQLTSGQLDSHTIELRYQSAATLPAWGTLESIVPRLECRVASAPIYWQLILPQGWQVTDSPAQLIPDYWLGWRHYRWGRQPTLTQADLEQITGAVSSMAPAPLSSQYVYRAFEFPESIQIVVIRQAWLLAACTLACFGLGVLCLHTRIAQSGIFWLGLSLALLLGAFSYPEITQLAAEVILAGGLMVFATHVLRRVFMSPSNAVVLTESTLPDSSELTEPWQQQLSVSQAISETTATLKTSGRSS